MNEMTPTNKLRFVKRDVTVRSEMNPDKEPEIIHVLQQWWEKKECCLTALGSKGYRTIGEWRDVPLEAENGND